MPAPRFLSVRGAQCGFYCSEIYIVSLNDFLAAKGEAYSRIDIERAPRFWRECGALFKTPPIVQIVGTNGKGSTGRILAIAARQAGLSVGHYASPHLLRFNERFWLNGRDATDSELEAAHRRVLAKIDGVGCAESQKTVAKIGGQAGDQNCGGWADALSYFEYATVLAIELFAECDLFVCEAGLGGEFDATSVFDRKLLLVTPIDLDHKEFLGATIEEIAATKLRAMRCPAILARQERCEVYLIAATIAKERGFEVFRAEDLAPPIESFAKKNGEKERDCDAFGTENLAPSIGKTADENYENEPFDPPFMRVNRQLAFAAARFLKIDAPIERFRISPMFGRLAKIAPNITIDAGHNPAAARAVAEAFRGQKVTLIYNSYSDKDFRAVLKILKPIVKNALIAAVQNSRIAPKAAIEAALKETAIEFGDFDGAIDAKENYLVFGSFSVVEAFLKARDAR